MKKKMIATIPKRYPRPAEIFGSMPMLDGPHWLPAPGGGGGGGA
jgi:hypothetical protein